MMTIIHKLAASLNRKDEGPNQELAVAIAEREDVEAVEELISLLNHKDKNIQSDCIKVLYEIGALRPDLIADYDEAFFKLLNHPNNRLVWGAMTALDAITLHHPAAISSGLAQIVDAADKGSVITKDHAVQILIKLCSLESYAGHAFPLLLAQIRQCPTNQLPMYAENATVIINDNNRSAFIDTLATRLSEIDKESKRKRLEKVITKQKRLLQ